ncbi:MAG: metallophosphoesterase [Nitrospinae bacterium]|nr:metallophosphoesterase [Nitrospinota bacterium]
MKRQRWGRALDVFSRFAGTIFLVIAVTLLLKSAPVQGGESTDVQNFDAPGRLRVAVIGDTGIGDRVYHKGFSAVLAGIGKERPDILLHLGDFIYQSEWLPEKCDPRFLQEVRDTLATPFRFRIFVPGDNDLSPHPGKPLASRCWPEIEPLGTPLDAGDPGAADKPSAFEGTRTIGNVLFAVLNSFPWNDPTAWLKPRIDRARAAGFWVVVALHEPPVTTAWYLEKRQTVLRQINALNPDLVFSGNQHSYERFHALGVPMDDGTLPAVKPEEGSVYRQGSGSIHIVSGGGGALIKPFADLQGEKDMTAPKEAFDALATRALMNHFIVLDISQKELLGRTYRVCPGTGPGDQEDPRWKPRNDMWRKIALACDGQPAGTTLFDQFKILAR